MIRRLPDRIRKLPDQSGLRFAKSLILCKRILKNSERVTHINSLLIVRPMLGAGQGHKLTQLTGGRGVRGETRS